MRRARLLVALAPLVVASACGGGDDDDSAGAADAGYNCALDERGETFTAGMTKTGAGEFVFTLEDAVPGPPAKGDNSLTVRVEAPAGAATDLALAVLPCMPDHGHGTPIVPTVTVGEGGSYTIERVNLWMPGLWDLSVAVTDGEPDVARTCTSAGSEAPLDEAVFRFCVDG